MEEMSVLINVSIVLYSLPVLLPDSLSFSQHVSHKISATLPRGIIYLKHLHGAVII